jgi:hypothetical protein
MKKENIIVIFYVLYFSWLFTVAFLTPSTNILNYFTSVVTLFYFLFLRGKGDFSWFWISALFPLFFAAFSLAHWQIKFEPTLLYYTPLWLPLAWGTTIVALRKFYTLISR